MARYNEILTGRFNRALQKLMSMKGSASLVTLADEMMTVLPLPIFPWEWYLFSTETFGFMTGIAAQGVGNLGQIQLRNPVGSNVIGYILQVTVQPSVNDSFSIGYNAPGTDLATVASTHGIDTRGRTAGTMVLSLGVGTAVGTTQSRLSVLGTQSSQFINDALQGYIVNPGQTFLCQNAATNTLINGIGMLYLERFLEESERA